MLKAYPHKLRTIQNTVFSILFLVSFIQPSMAAKGLDAPVLDVPVAGDSEVALSWSAVGGAKDYIVKSRTASQNYGPGQAVGNITSFTVTGLANGTEYFFVIAASGKGGQVSADSNEVSAIPQSADTPPAAPSLNTPSAGDAQVDLSWNSVSGADYYNVKYGTAPGAYGTTIPSINTTNYTVTGLTNGSTYYFIVTAKNAVGESDDSNEESAVPQAPSLPAAPSLNSAVAGDTQVDLSWNAVSGAQFYNVKFGTASATYDTTVNAGNVTNYTVTGLTNDITYYFVVSAENTVGESGDSNEQSATPQAAPADPPPLTLLSAIAGDGEMALAWTAVNGAKSYIVRQGTTSGVYTDNTDVGDVLGHTVTGLTNGTTYYFAVAAIKGKNPTGNSNELSATPQAPNTPPTVNAGLDTTVHVTAALNLDGTVTDDGLPNPPGAVTTAWTMINGPGIVTFGDMTAIDTTAGFSVNGLYILRLTADDSFLSSFDEVTITVDPLSAPNLTSAAAGDGEVTLTWDPVTQATGYNVKFGTAPNTYGSPVNVGNVTNYVVTNLTNDTAYYFVVTSLNGSIESTDSGELTATPQAAVTTEDFLTFSGNDPTGNITITSECIAFSTIETRNTDAYVYKDYGSITNFKHGLDVLVTGASGLSGPMLIWGASDTPAANWQNWNNGVLVGLYHSGDPDNITLLFREVNNGTIKQFSAPIDIAFFQRHYVDVIREGPSLTVKVYSDSDRTNLQDQKSVTLAIGPEFQYLYGLSTFVNGSTNHLMTGDVCNLSMDEIILITGNSVDPRIINPVHDESAQINYTLQESADVTIKIYDSETEALVRTLVDNQSRNAGPNSETWDGRDDIGQIVPFALYDYTIHAQNGSGDEGSFDPIFDPNIPDPQIINATVTPGGTISAVTGERLKITYDLSEPAIVSFGFSPYINYVQNEPRGTAGNVEYWNGREDNGAMAYPGNLDDVPFKVQAKTKAFQANMIAVDETTTLDIPVLRADPYVIRPLYNERTQITYSVNEDATVSVSILDQSGNTVLATLETSVFKTAGTYILTWDGKSDGGELIVNNADNRIRVEAIDAYGASFVRDGNIRVLY